MNKSALLNYVLLNHFLKQEKQSISIYLYIQLGTQFNAQPIFISVL